MRKLIKLETGIHGTGHTFYVGDKLESLRQYLAVLAYFDDGTVKLVKDFAILNSDGSDEISSDGTAYVEYRGMRAYISVAKSLRESNTPIYDWDFKKSLIDERQGLKAIPFSRFSNTANLLDAAHGPKCIPGIGIYFGATGQGVILLPPSVHINEELFGKTVQIDVDGFSANPANVRFHTRLLMFGRTSVELDVSNYTFDSGIVYRYIPSSGTDTKWNVYAGSNGWGSGFANMADLVSISGKKLSFYFNASGNVKFYVDGVSKGVSSVNFNGNDFYGMNLGDIQGSYTEGSTFYPAIVSGVRIYEGDVA